MSNLQLEYPWDELLATHHLEEPRVLNGAFVRSEIERAVGTRRNGADLLAEFHSLGEVVPSTDGRRFVAAGEPSGY